MSYIEEKTRILLATPMMPPTAGGPATHAVKLLEYFSESNNFEIEFFNFEKYKKYPSGLRHLLAFVEIFYKSIDIKIILCLDAFTVAIPSLLASKILGKKLILRVGGDFVYEQFLYIKEVSFEDFYVNISENRKNMTYKLYFKFIIQKYIIENADKIIFNSNYQKQIYIKFYKLKKEVEVIENPIISLDKSTYENERYDVKSDFIFTSITRDIPYKNQKRLKKAFANVKQELDENISSKMTLETKQGSHASCLKRISLSRCYICASISDIYPNQVIEAVSLGIPIIMTKYSGLNNLLLNSKSVIFIDPFNEKDIQNAILEMYDEEKYEMYKKEAEHFRDNFIGKNTWKDLCGKYEIIISQSCIK